MGLRLVMTVVAGALAAATLPVTAAPPALATGPDCLATASTTFTYTGSAQTCTLPVGVVSVLVEVAGGSGGSDPPNGVGGTGDAFSTVLTIPAGTSALEVNVGGNGGAVSDENPGSGGWNGGQPGGQGSRGVDTLGHGGGGGGGGTDIRPPGAAASSAFVVAGGGGGAGGVTYAPFNILGDPPEAGGNGGAGGFTPGNGASPNPANTPTGGPGGASLSADGTPGQLSGVGNGAGGGGGGGWRGGFGGNAEGVTFFNYGGGGGGGGSSYVQPGVTTTPLRQTWTAPSAMISYATITPPSFATLTVAQSFTGTFTTNYATSEWVLQAGSPPPGMTFDNGVLSGTPTVSGAYDFTVLVAAYPDANTELISTLAVTAVVQGGPPVAVATGATEIQSDRVTANGSITGGGYPVTQVFCKYAQTLVGVDTGTSVAALPYSQPSMVATFRVQCPITGLTPATTYFYKVYAVDSDGNNAASSAATFVTGSLPPQVSAENATQVTATSATANGRVTATNQAVTDIFCRYATTPAGVATGTRVTASPASASSTSSSLAVSCELSGLTTFTRYFYAVYATDADGTGSSPVLVSFVTSASPPVVALSGSPSVTPSSATVSATVTPTGKSVTAIFCRVGATVAAARVGALVTASPSLLDASAGATSVSCSFSGLPASTTYRYFVFASDSVGTTTSPLGSFVTSAPPSSGGGGSPPPATTTPATPAASGSVIVTAAPPLEVTTRTALGTGTVQAGAEPFALTCLVSQAAGRDPLVVLASPPAVAAGRTAVVACPIGDLQAGSSYSFAIEAQSSTEAVTSNRISFTTKGRSADLISPPKRLKPKGVTVLLPEARFTAAGAPVRVLVTARSTSGPGRIEVRTDPSGRVSVRTFNERMTVTVTYTASNPILRRTKTYRV
jgi:chitodextrinase